MILFHMYPVVKVRMMSKVASVQRCLEVTIGRKKERKMKRP